jgi:outer membrane protein OmpA-like peptidoglycan-associated protein
MGGGDNPSCSRCQEEVIMHEHDGYVTREEFIDLMLALRSELAAINARLDDMDRQPAGAPVSVPVSVQVTTPASQNQGQSPVIVNTTTPAPVQMDSKNPPFVINTSASAIAPAAAPANINVSNTTASAAKTDPVNVGVSSSNKTEPINVSSALKTEPVNATSASASKTDPINVSSGSKTEPINVGGANASSATAPSPVSVNTSVPAQNAPGAKKPEKTIIKVQQIPIEPRQRIMEEIFEVRFDFDKATIKPEYENIIRQLASATQANKNIKVSVVGHTDTAGSSAYNYALGGRRAEAVQKMLIAYGIPASQIIAVSAGEEDLKVPTPNNTPNAENRRVRVVKEVQYTEQPKPAPIIVEEFSETDDCDECEEE